MYICIYIYGSVSRVHGPPHMVWGLPPHPPIPHAPTPPPTPAHHIHKGEGYIDICIDTYIDICIDTYIYYILYTFAHIHATYVYTSTYIYIYIHTYVYIHIYIYVCMYVCMYVCIHPYMMNNFRNHFSCMFCWSMATQFPIPTGACALFCRSAFAALCQSQLRGTELMV